VANDTGGAIAQLVVTRHPERIGRLVLTNCDAYENFLPPMFRPLAADGPGARRARVCCWRRCAPDASATCRWPSRAQRAGIDPALSADWLEPARNRRRRAPGPEEDAARYLEPVPIEAARQLRTFSGPTLLAWGRDDSVLQARYAERLATEFADARLEWIDDARAFVPIDQPARLAQLIADFTR